MKVIKAGRADSGALSRMGALLYGSDEAHILAELTELMASESQHFWLAVMDEEPVGFAHALIRTDYVEGTDGGPVGYLEGIYLAPEHRGRGAARALLKACEDWAVSMGAKQFASDCLLANTQSIAFHQSVGFREANRIVCFVKEL